jgi:hypothetical protein
MKLIWIERKEETDNYQFTKAKFKPLWGEEFISTCVTEKGMSCTKYFDSGNDIPVSLWTPFIAFLESDLNYIYI